MAHDQTGLAFEEDVARRFRSLGWSVRPTARTGDFGADLIATSESETPETIAIQCKDYASPVGIEAVQEVLLAKVYYTANAAAVVAPNGFTPNARHAAKRARVGLIHPDELVSGCTLDRSAEQRQREAAAAEARKRAEAREREAEEARRKASAEAQRKEDERRRSAEEQRKRASAEALSRSWRQYDTDVKRFHRLAATRGRIATLVSTPAIVLAATAFMLPRHAALLIDSLIFLAAAALGLVGQLRAKAPELPAPSRRGALIPCNGCSTTLRVDYGREGTVQCPLCGARTPART